MQIVIDIDKEYYKAITEIPNHQCTADMLIIKNGTPLDNIKAEISEKKANSGAIAHKVAYSNCLEIIDKHTSGGDTE